MALTFWLRINEKKHLFAGEDYFLSILGLDALPGLLLAFSHRPKETFPLILNFGATELALPVARVWHRFAGQRNLARQWILQWWNIRLLHLFHSSLLNPATTAKRHYLPFVYCMNKDIVNYCKRLQTAGIALICGQPWKNTYPEPDGNLPGTHSKSP